MRDSEKIAKEERRGDYEENVNSAVGELVRALWPFVKHARRVARTVELKHYKKFTKSAERHK